MSLKKLLYKAIVQNPFRYKRWQRDMPGHFYSPIASREDFQRIKHKLYDFNATFPGIHFDVGQMRNIYHDAVSFFSKNRLPDGNRFIANNTFLYNGDAMMLFYFLNKLKPSQVIEIGSGFSSALMLDTNETFEEKDKAQLIFIEPFPKRLKSILKEGDVKKTTIYEMGVQTISLDVFKKLRAGDILFIDSSHVSKVGSDLNYILFEIIPVLSAGVIIHFHDIFYNFEYPEKWIMEGRNWNEAYLIRAFLQYNESFEIMFFNSFANHLFNDTLQADLPGFKNDFIGSLWLKKTR